MQEMIKQGRVDEPSELTTPQFTSVDLSVDLISLFSDKSREVILNKRICNMIHQRLEWRGDIRYQNLDSVLDLLLKLDIKSADKDTVFPPNTGWNRLVDVVRFIGFSCEDSLLSEASAKLINIINELSEKDSITGVLCPLSYISMSNEDGTPNGKVAVFSYIAINCKDDAYFMNKYKDIVFQECTTPMELV